jgi:hypothetical protein
LKLLNLHAHKMPAVASFVAAAAVSLPTYESENLDESLLAAQRLANIVVTTKRELLLPSHHALSCHLVRLILLHYNQSRTLFFP